MHRLPALSPDAVLPHDPPELSPREREAVRLLSAQMSTTQIADTLSISINTFRTRVRRALGKLDATDGTRL